MVPICSHCPNCSTQWSLVVMTAVPNAPICSTQLSPLRRPIVPTAVPKASNCSAQCPDCNAQCHHLQWPMLPSAVPNIMIYLSIYLLIGILTQYTMNSLNGL